MEEQIQEIVQEVLEAKNLASDDESLVTRYVKRTVLRVLAHCNRTDIPEGLQATIAQIAEDMLEADGVVSSADTVSSIKRGDTQINYLDPTSAYQSAIDFIKDYDCALVHYRKMKIPYD